MCGIAGVFNYQDSSEPLTVELLSKIRETLHHRGPDDADLWISEDHRVGLAHRRLSIVDLSPDGRQPMTNEDGSLQVTFNGEIYNHLDWRPQLEQKGHRFRSRSDTEIILHLYEEFGVNCVDHLDGMFAFGLWDANKRLLFLARDRLGVKPLYYTLSGGSLIFGSEIKALLAHPKVTRELDVEALGHYLSFKTTPAPSTLFAGIKKLQAGSILTCDDQGHVQVSPYWDAVSREHPPRTQCDEVTTVAEIRGLLDRAVDKRLMADVPLGVFLSGGLDSSAVVALMAPRTSQPIRTFSLGIKDIPGHNELNFAKQVSDQFGTDHKEIMIGQNELIDYLPQLVETQDEPLADPVCVPLFYLSKLATESGVKVVMVGEGSDEQFLGYESRISVLKRYQKTWEPLMKLPRGVLKGLHGVSTVAKHATGRGARLEQILAMAVEDGTPFRGSPGFSDAEKARILTEAVANLGANAGEVVAEICAPLRQAWPRREAAATMSYLDIKLRLAELLLMRIDKVTMSVGLEAREPFLDYHLVEYLMRLPLNLKLKNWDAKYLLKQALEGLLPENIIRRPKQAFSAPVGDWIRNGMEEFIRRVIFDSSLRQRNFFHYHVIEQMLQDHIQGKADNGVALWTLANLSAWYDHWFSEAA